MKILIDRAGVISEREVTPAQADVMGGHRLLLAKHRAGRFKLSVTVRFGKVSSYRCEYADGDYKTVYLQGL